MSKKMECGKPEEVSLPKNIQQMGCTDGGTKIYLEDYSATWIRRILMMDENKHGILLGRRKTDARQTYLFIEAVLMVDALEMDKQWKYNWNAIYEMMQKYFYEEGQEKIEVLGWAMPIEDYGKLDLDWLETMHKSNFDGNKTLAFTIDRQENREQFYILENNRFHSMGGYYIYYEKNKAMQNYVLECQPGPCVETESFSKGNGETYRSHLLRQKEVMKKRYSVSVLYAASTFLVMLVMVLGITMMNNYEKIHNMEGLLDELSQSVLNGEARAENDVSQPAAELVASELTHAGEVTPISENAVEGEAVQAMSSSVVQSHVMSEGGRKRYVIQPGDTLAAISIEMYNTDQMVEKICDYNGIEDGNQIVAGDVLLLP